MVVQATVDAAGRDRHVRVLGVESLDALRGGEQAGEADMGRTFLLDAGDGGFAPRPASRPLTRFEARGERLGHQVRDLLFSREG